MAIPLEIKQKAQSSTPCEEFDYECSKKKYFKLISLQPKPRTKLMHLNRHRFNEVVRNLLICEQHVVAGKDCSPLPKHSCYKQFKLLRESDGKIFVIKRNISPDEPIIKHLIIEDSFDIFAEIHLANGHCGRDKLRKFVKQTYEICIIYMDLFLRSCNVCLSRKKRETGTTSNTSADSNVNGKKLLMEIYNMSPRIDGEFKFILLCQDVSTSFLFLRPLRVRCQQEVATELLKIILSFGSPKFTILVKPKNQDFFWDTVKVMRQFGMNHIMSVEKIIETKFIKICDNIRRNIHIWLVDSGTTNWALGCHIVQWKLNNRPVTFTDKHKRHSTGKTPYFSTFNRVPMIYVKDSTEAEGDYSIFESDSEEYEIIRDLDKDDEPVPQEKEKTKYTLDFIQNYIKEKGLNNDNDDITKILKNTN